MSEKNTVTEWEVEGEVTPEMIQEAERELNEALFNMVWASMTAPKDALKMGAVNKEWDMARRERSAHKEDQP